MLNIKKNKNKKIENAGEANGVEVVGPTVTTIAVRAAVPGGSSRIPMQVWYKVGSLLPQNSHTTLQQHHKKESQELARAAATLHCENLIK